MQEEAGGRGDDYRHDAKSMLRLMATQIHLKIHSFLLLIMCDINVPQASKQSPAFSSVSWTQPFLMSQKAAESITTF